ncbi:MAG TPA: murein biosynthesis integral membrane protein MurJ [Candidatus Babeliales bacterium]|nr:murein biosynthesis integral membrane protein MurJ [Candidatus Babeliales bacterium]
MNKHAILKKTSQVGILTLFSRGLGLVREYLLGRYLGAGMLSDAFFAAYKIPNYLRKIFAEGALSSSFVPVIVAILKGQPAGRAAAGRLMTLSFIAFEGVLISLCLLMYWFADVVVYVAAPGFSLEKAAYTISLLKIMVPFVVFISSSALLAGAMQAINHFFIPAFGPVLLNLIFVGGLVLGLLYNLPVEFLCYAVLLGGLVNFALHLLMYWQYGFRFGAIDQTARANFKQLLTKFFPIMFGMSIMEINLFVDTSFASYLADGSLSIVRYASRFVGIPLGVFAVAFATILLPHFSRINAYAPKRLSFYLFEATKFIFWVMAPVSILLAFEAGQIFQTLFLSSKFTLAKVLQAQSVLIAFTLGLFFYSINKILLNIYYSKQDTKIPTQTSIIAAALNLVLSPTLMYFFKATGIGLATTISAIVQTGLLFYFLHTRHQFELFPGAGVKFLRQYSWQLALCLPTFWLLHIMARHLISLISTAPVAHFLLTGVGYWLWDLPLAGLLFLVLLQTRKRFGLRLYFLD